MSSDAEQKLNGSPSNREKKNKVTHRRQTTYSSSSLHYSQLYRTGNTTELGAEDIPSLQSDGTDIDAQLLPTDKDGNIITPYPQDYKQRRLSEQFNIRINTYRGKYIIKKL